MQKSANPIGFCFETCFDGLNLEDGLQLAMASFKIGRLGDGPLVFWTGHCNPIPAKNSSAAFKKQLKFWPIKFEF